MNTTKVGNELEKKIFDYFDREIRNERFIARSENCKIFSKKAYFSKDRNKNIIFDISIEIYNPGESDYSLLYIIECKNYSHPVPVNDVEEFHSKISQVSAHKGIIASTNTFDAGCFNFSASKKIGLLRYFNDDSTKWELNRVYSGSKIGKLSKFSSFEIYQALTLSDFKSLCNNFYYSDDMLKTSDMNHVFANFIRFALNKEDFDRISNNSNTIKSSVKFLKSIDIENLTIDIRNNSGYSVKSLDMTNILKIEETKNRLKILDLPSKSEFGWRSGILGRLDFKSMEITLYNNENINIHQRRFTLAHELGHYFLNHSKYFTSECFDQSDYSFVDAKQFSNADIIRLEWQANHFASCLLLPRETLIDAYRDLLKYHNIRQIKKGILYVDNQKENIQNYFDITNVLKLMFNVSRRVIRFRLEHLGLLEYQVKEEWTPTSMLISKNLNIR